MILLFDLSEKRIEIPRISTLIIISIVVFFLLLIIILSKKETDTTKIVCFGDSITKGSSFNGWTALLQKKLNAWGKIKYSVVNKGCYGDTTVSALERFCRDIEPCMPGFVLLEFGINDANYRIETDLPRVSIETYRENIKELSRLIKSKEGDCIFIVNHPLISSERYSQGNGRSYNENLKPYNAVLRELSLELNIPVIDMYRSMIQDEKILKKCLKDDGVHLSRYGNQFYADILLSELQMILARDM